MRSRSSSSDKVSDQGSERKMRSKSVKPRKHSMVTRKLSHESLGQGNDGGHQMRTRKKARNEKNERKAKKDKKPAKKVKTLPCDDTGIKSEDLAMDIEEDQPIESGKDSKEEVSASALPQIDESPEYRLTANEKLNNYKEFIADHPLAKEDKAEIDPLDGLNFAGNEKLIDDKLKNAFCNLVKLCNESAELPKCYTFDDRMMSMNSSLNIGVVKFEKLSNNFIESLGQHLKKEKYDIILMQHCNWTNEYKELFDLHCRPYKLYYKKGKTNYFNAIMLSSTWRLTGTEMDDSGRIVLMRLSSPQTTCNVINVNVVDERVRLSKEFISKNLEWYMGEEINLIGGYFGLAKKNLEAGGLSKFMTGHSYNDCCEFLKDGKSRKLEKKRVLIKSELSKSFMDPEVGSVKMGNDWMLTVKLKRKIEGDKFVEHRKVVSNAQQKEEYLKEREAEFLRVDKARKKNLEINAKVVERDPRYDTRVNVEEEEKKKRATDLVDAFGNKIKNVPNTAKCAECGYSEGFKKLAQHYGKCHSPLVCFSCEKHLGQFKGSIAMLEHVKKEHFSKWGSDLCKFCVLEGNRNPKSTSGWKAYIHYYDHMKYSHREVYNCLLSCKVGTESDIWGDEEAKKVHLHMAHLVDTKELNDALYELWNSDLRNLCLKCGSKNYFPEFDKVEQEIVDRDFSWSWLGQEDFYKFMKKGDKLKVCKKCKGKSKKGAKKRKSKNDFFTIYGKNFEKFHGLVYGLQHAPNALKNAWRIIETSPVEYCNPVQTGRYAFKEGELSLRMKESNWPLFVHILGFLSLDKSLRRQVFEFDEAIEDMIKKYIEGFYLIWDLNYSYRDFYKRMLESGGLKVPASTTGYELIGLVVKYFMMQLMAYFFEKENSIFDEPESFMKIASFIQVRGGTLFVRRGPNHFVNIKNEYLLYKARLWTWMFVELFLLDKGDMLEYLDKSEAENEGKLKSHMNEYSKEILKGGLDVFQQCPEFVLALFERYQAHQKLTNGVAFRSNMNISARQFVDLKGDKFMYETLDNKVRGSGSYFKKSMLKLTALTAKYGNPSFFVTFSFDEKSWLELSKIIGPDKFISGMPVNIVMQIIKRFGTVNADFLKLYKNEDGLLGRVNSYFIRLEMQERGTLHFHMLLWVDEKDKGLSLIRGNMPNKGMESLLAHLVKSRQIHVCDEGCLIERQGLKMCKYLYPRKYGVYHVTYNEDLDMFDYPCPSMQDSYVVPYVSLLLLFCRSGMDIKVFDDKRLKEIVKYVTKYLTKKVKKQVTTPEAVVGIIQTKHIRESEEIVNIPCSRDNEISKPLKKQAQIAYIAVNDPNTKDIYYDSKHEIYVARPAEYEDCSYGEYFQKYEYSYQASSREGGIRDRKGRWIYACKDDKAIMTTLSSTTNLNKQAYFLLKLFKPHRKEADLIEGNKVDSETGEEYTNDQVYRYFDTFEWAHYYRTLIWNNAELKARMERTHAYKFIELLKKIIIHTRNDIENPTSAIEQLDKMYSDKKEGVDLSDIKLKLEKIDRAFAKCSEEQKKLLTLISVYLEDYFVNRVAEHGIAIQGAAGTGKSYMIKLINKLCKVLELHCEIVAPTGISAFNVGGKTYHSYLSFCKGDVKKAGTLEYAKMKLKQEDKFRLMKTDVLIIEEMSMVGNKGLNAICFFMQAAGLEFGISKQFGGKCVIMFGDFMQLPPVKQEMTYKAESFSYFTEKYSLESNQRAKEDAMFQYVLEKIRMNDIDDDVDRILKSREKDANKVTAEDIIYLYGKRNHVEAKNEAMIKRLSGKSQVSRAIESPPFEELLEKYKRPEWSEVYAQKMMAPKSLYLHRDCRYVLLKNIDKEFVNGSIVRVLFSEHIDLSQCIEICLVHDPRISCIIRRQKEWIKFKHEGGKINMHVKQFPLAPAFAMTIHKVQGMTLDRIAVDLGAEDIFAKHQAYVAVSRVRHLKDLFLFNYSRDAFMIDNEVAEEIKRFVPATLLQGIEEPSKILGQINADDTKVVLDLIREKNLDMIIKMQIPVVNNSLELFCDNPTSFTETDMLLGKQDPQLLEELKAQILRAKDIINKQYHEFSSRNSKEIEEVMKNIKPKRPAGFKYKGKRSRPKPREQRKGPPEFVKDLYEEALKHKGLHVLEQLKKDMQENVIPQIQMKSLNREIDPWIITQITTPHRIQPFKYFKDNIKSESGKEKAMPKIEETEELEPRKKIKASAIDQLIVDLEKVIIQPKIQVQADIRSFGDNIINEGQAMQIEEPGEENDILMDVDDQPMSALKEILDQIIYEPKIGLQNIGSTCYFNVIMQVLAALGIPTRNSIFNEIVLNLRSGYTVPRETIEHAVKSFPYTRQLYDQHMEGEAYILLNELFGKTIVDFAQFYNDITCICEDGHVIVESDTHINVEGDQSVEAFFKGLNQRMCTREDCSKPIITVTCDFAKYLIVLRTLWFVNEGRLTRNENRNFIDKHFAFDNKHFLFRAAVCWRGANDKAGHYYAKIYHNHGLVELSDKNKTNVFQEKYVDWNLAFYEIIG